MKKVTCLVIVEVEVEDKEDIAPEALDKTIRSLRPFFRGEEEVSLTVRVIDGESEDEYIISNEDDPI